MQNETSQPLTIGILIFDEVEVLDVAGPFEVFSVAGRLQANTPDNDTEPIAMRAITIAQTSRIINARGALHIEPHFTFETHPPLDVLVVPGGRGTRYEVENLVLLDWLRRVLPTVPVKASVCTGSFLLAKVGVFDGLKATTHWASLDRMAQIFPRVEVVRDMRWVDEGKVLSSAGVSAGIDLSLHLVERMFGRDMAQKTARQMEYEGQYSDRS